MALGPFLVYLLILSNRVESIDCGLLDSGLGLVKRFVLVGEVELGSGFGPKLQ